MTSNTTFAEIGVDQTLHAVLAKRGITAPFPVQEMVIPLALEGRDLQVRAPTGSGKTLTFGLPILQRAISTGRPTALILAPTRELAGQIEGELTGLAHACDMTVASVVGGVNMDRQARKAARADVLVATPGRLMDLIRRRLVSVDDINCLVLDEADRMLDMGFAPQVEAIVATLPEERQTMMFSATLGAEVMSLARTLTRTSTVLEVPGDPGTDATMAERLDQSFVACAHASRVDALMGLIADEEDLVIVFCRTKRGAARLAERLHVAGIAAGALHGDLTQAKRDRALKSFAAGRTRVLAATDVASRGIDLDDIGLVVNYDPPEDHDTYTHRVGRTARAGRTGRAVTLVSPDQAGDVGRIALRLGLQEHWEAAGFGPAVPQVVYRSRGRRGPAPARPAATPRTRPQPATAPTNRVRRGSRAPA